MRILLADHHPQALWALKTTLQEEDGYQIIGEATNTSMLINLTENQDVDLLLLDIGLPGMPIQELIPILHNHEPRLIVVAMSSKIEEDIRLLGSGADAFISKSEEPGRLVKALRDFANRFQNKEDSSSSKLDK